MDGDILRTLGDLDRRVTKSDNDIARLAGTVQEVAEAVRAQQIASTRVEKQLTEISASLKATPKADMGRFLSLAAAAGAVVAMLVGGITYVVNGSQQPLIGDMRARQQLLEYRLEQLERFRAPSAFSRSGYYAAF